MATYEYICPVDHTEKAVVIPLSEYSSEDVVLCPKCQSQMHRTWSGISTNIK